LVLARIPAASQLSGPSRVYFAAAIGSGIFGSRSARLLANMWPTWRFSWKQRDVIMSNRHRARVTTVVSCSQAGKQDRPLVQGDARRRSRASGSRAGHEEARRAGLAGRAECSLSFRSSGSSMGVTASATTPTTRRSAIGSGQATGAQKFSRVRVLPLGKITRSIALRPSPLYRTRQIGREPLPRHRTTGL
jgi:hypothetical protein